MTEDALGCGHSKTTRSPPAGSTGSESQQLTWGSLSPKLWGRAAVLSAEAAGVLGVVAGTSSMVTEDWVLALEAAPFGFLPSAGRAVGR